jgi:sulfoquinovosidase
MRKKLITIVLPVGLVSLLIIFGYSWVKEAYSTRPLLGKLTINDPSLQTGMHYFQAGNFQIQVIASGQENEGKKLEPRLVIVHKDAPGRWLWYSHRGEAFVAAAQGQEQVEEQRGSFFFSDRITRRCADQTIRAIQPSTDGVIISGSLNCQQGKPIDYSLEFRPVSDRQLTFQLSFSDNKINRSYLTYASDSDEHFFGFGEQFTYFDLKGHLVPIWVSEQGIGRGQQPLTFLVNLAARAGGNPFTTYAAVPHYITSRLRSVFLENPQYCVFDLRQPDRVQIHVLSPILSGRILFGQNPEELVSEYTAWIGRMRPLPDWILNGAVIGMQGGTERVRQVYDQLKNNKVPVSAFWLQDWVGQRTTSFGKQLWWNWELDNDRYPNWNTLRQDLEQDGVRLMVYTSPFLADVSNKPNVRRNYFTEAVQNNFLVKQPDGKPYLIKNTDFSAGLVDLTNPTARDWYKTVLRESLIDEAGASGWMADFGEALPYDAVLANGATGKDFHNRYPEAWAQLNRELVDSLPNGPDIVFFQRAAFQHSPQYSTLFWEGDQLVSWDQYDGLKSAVTGLLSGGISGFSLNHSDIGGYTTLNNPLARYHRSKELLMRWMEFSAMTTIYRTHEGNLPEYNSQFYSDAETLAQFTRMARVYAAWKPLRLKLVKEATQTGMPVARHLFLQYPDDPNVYQLSYQEYFLGSDILVAPVLDPGKDTLKVYLPTGDWVHLWSGRIYRTPYAGTWVTVPAPLGQPGIFYREGSADGIDFRLNLIHAGLLQ